MASRHRPMTGRETEPRAGLPAICTLPLRVVRIWDRTLFPVATLPEFDLMASPPGQPLGRTYMPVTASRKARHLAPYVAALALAPALAVATAAPASADLGPIDLPAGVACASFDLRVAGTGDKRIMREFTDENGNVVRLLSAGK